MATFTPSEACCTVPPVVVKDYKEKGEFIELNGRKTYRTGPTDATSAILWIPDVFGFFPQSLQGADILAYSGHKNKYQVFFPDYFDGKPYPIEQFPTDTPEKQQKLKDFFGSTGSPVKGKQTAEDTVEAIKKHSPQTTKFGVFGTCWGAKVVSFLSQKDSLFSVAGEVHPAMVDANDAKGFTIPVIMLASKDEPADAVKAFKEALTVPNHVETFEDQIHGWMAARSNLADQRVADEYKRGYQTTLDFICKYL